MEKGIRPFKDHCMLGLLFALGITHASLVIAQDFEETTNTKVEDGSFPGGYTQKELDSMSKEQKAIMNKFMKGRYSSAKGESSRYSNILEYHDNNFDGITEHDRANNAAESSGDKVGLGKTGLRGAERRRAMALERILSSDNCELTKEEQELMSKDKNFFNISGAVKGKYWDDSTLAPILIGREWNKYLEIDPAANRIKKKATLSGDDEKKAEALLKEYRKRMNASGYFTEIIPNTNKARYRLICPNVSAVVLDRGDAHGSDMGSGHRIYELNEKTFTAGKGQGSPLEGATGEAINVAQQYANATVSDSARTAIPPEIIAAMRKRGMDVWTENDGKVVATRLPDGTITRDNVMASPDDLKSEFAWLEAQKKNRLNETWKTLRAERFITGDSYNPAAVSSEIGSLIAKNAAKSEKEKDQIVATKVAEHDLYGGVPVCLPVQGSGTNISLGTPRDCPDRNSYVNADLAKLLDGKPLNEVCTPGKTCFLRAGPQLLRGQKLSRFFAGGASVTDYTQVALDAAKREAAKDKDLNARIAKSKAHVESRIKACMARNKWCEKIDIDPSITKVSELPDNLKNKGISQADIEAGVAYVETKGDPGNAFKDTREYVSVQMETAMEGGINNFVKTVESADFNASTDAKTKGKPFEQMRRQAEINKKIAQDVLAYSEWAYNECIRLGGDSCKRQFDKSNFDPNTMNAVQLFGRNPDRDGKTLNTTQTNIGEGELTKPKMDSAPGSSSFGPRVPASSSSSGPMPTRGSAPRAAPTPFSLN